jgi:hypothetical protein
MSVAFIFEAEKETVRSPELGLIFGGDGFILPVTSDSGRITAVPVAAVRLGSHGKPRCSPGPVAWGALSP